MRNTRPQILSSKFLLGNIGGHFFPHGSRMAHVTKSKVSRSLFPTSSNRLLKIQEVGKTKEGGQSPKMEKPQDGRQKLRQNMGNPQQMEDNKNPKGAAPKAPPCCLPFSKDFLCFGMISGAHSWISPLLFSALSPILFPWISPFFFWALPPSVALPYT